jgi:hypothetical protein
MTKEELEKLFDIPFLDWEVEWFNAMLQAYREGKRLIVGIARQRGRTKLSQCFDIYRALESGIKVNQVYFDECIGGRKCIGGLNEGR